MAALPVYLGSHNTRDALFRGKKREKRKEGEKTSAEIYARLIWGRIILVRRLTGVNSSEGQNPRKCQPARSFLLNPSVRRYCVDRADLMIFLLVMTKSF